MTKVVMKFFGLLFPFLLLPFFAGAQPREFPMNATYKAISISGFDVQRMDLTLTVTKSGDGFRGSGSAGCNNWTARVMLREDQIDFTAIATTKKMCDKGRMTAEEAFTNSLRTAQRWRFDDKNRLIIEGEAARLLLTASKK
ncbi:MAG: META domain-containing protein [Xanthobacteraceae bacterium]|nr:META domain-containing protein [Xanthobacteraceae bacterium]